MEVVPQAGAPDRELALVRGAEPRLDVHAGGEAKDIVEIRLTSCPDPLRPDQGGAAGHARDRFLHLGEIRVGPEDRDLGNARRLRVCGGGVRVSLLCLCGQCAPPPGGDQQRRESEPVESMH